MAKTTLYDLTGIAADLATLLDAPELDADSRAKAEAMQAELLNCLIPAKVESYCHVIAQLKGESEMYAAEAKRLTDRARARGNDADRLKDRLREALALAACDKLKAGVWTVALQNAPPSVEVKDEAAIPKDFWKQPAPQLDRAAVLDALKAGTAVAGCELHQSKHLRIR